MWSVRHCSWGWGKEDTNKASLRDIGRKRHSPTDAANCTGSQKTCSAELSPTGAPTLWWCSCPSHPCSCQWLMSAWFAKANWGTRVFFGLLLCTKSRKFVFSLKRKYFCTGILSVCLSMHLELLVPMTARERHQIPWITEHVSHHLGGSNQTQFLWKINQPVL